MDPGIWCLRIGFYLHWMLFLIVSGLVFPFPGFFSRTLHCRAESFCRKVLVPFTGSLLSSFHDSTDPYTEPCILPLFYCPSSRSEPGFPSLNPLPKSLVLQNTFVTAVYAPLDDMLPSWCARYPFHSCSWY